MSNSHKIEKIKLLKRITKGRHRCMCCIAGNSRMRQGKNQFVRMRRSVGC